MTYLRACLGALKLYTHTTLISARFDRQKRQILPLGGTFLFWGMGGGRQWMNLRMMLYGGCTLSAVNILAECRKCLTWASQSTGTGWTSGGPTHPLHWDAKFVHPLMETVYFEKLSSEPGERCKKSTPRGAVCESQREGAKGQTDPWLEHIHLLFPFSEQVHQQLSFTKLKKKFSLSLSVFLSSLSCKQSRCKD